MSAQQYRSEKKFIDDAVAKVREVVHSASKNDIILALHNYDFDVNKTVQAFCDDGAQSALNSWETSGMNGNKKKNPKKKKAKNAAKNSTSSVAGSVQPLETALPSSTYLVNGNATSSAIDGMAKLHLSHTGPESVTVNTANSLPTDVVDEPKMPLFSSVDAKNIPFDESCPLHTDHISEGTIGLTNHGKTIEKIESAFQNQLALAEENVRSAFKCVRQILAERESHLLAELRRTHDEGVRFFNERRVLACELAARAERMSAMSDREQTELRDEITRFVNEKQAEEEIGRTHRFIYDNSHLIRLVKNFGEVVGVKGIMSGTASLIRHVPAATSNSTYTVKRSTSHSSIVSSLGEDSGLGQISPVGNEDRKIVTEVANGGILMKSDALSAEQLADLNKKVQESLKAQGIDASLVTGIANRGSMPARRRPPGGGPRGGGGGGYSARGGGTSRGGKVPLVRVPNLSILQT